MVKKIDLEELLFFINSNYVDDRLYIVVPHLYEKDIRYEIMWSADLSEPKWFIREKGFNDFEYCTTDELISVLNKKNVNLIEVHVELIQKVLINVAHLNIIIDVAKDLFGKDMVDQACANLKDYYDDLQTTVEKIVTKKKPVEKKPQDKKAKTKLSLVKDEEHDSEDR